MSTHKITGTTPAAAGTAALGTPAGMLQNYDALRIVASTRGATGGTVDLYLQTSVDGTLWHDYAHLAQMADGAASATVVFSVSRHAQQTSITAIGTDLSPALAANTVLGGDFGNQMRAVAVAGVGTSAGRAQTITITGILRRV